MSVFHMSDPYEAGKVMQAGVDDMKLRRRAPAPRHAAPWMRSPMIGRDNDRANREGI